MCDPYARAVDQDFVPMNGNVLPCWACFVNDYTERKTIGCMDCPDPPLMLIQQEHVWYKLEKHKCSASSTTDAE